MAWKQTKATEFLIIFSLLNAKRKLPPGSQGFQNFRHAGKKPYGMNSGRSQGHCSLRLWDGPPELMNGYKKVQDFKRNLQHLTRCGEHKMATLCRFQGKSSSKISEDRVRPNTR
jgi:hypothetical protein